MRSARPLLIAVLLLAAVAVVAGVTRPGTPPAAAGATPATSAPAVRATLFCPDLRAIADTLTTTVTVGTPSPAAGSVTVAAAASTAGATPVLGGGQRTASYSGPVTGPLVLQAQGALSAGLVGDQVARANKTADRGWSEARCEPPRADEWFVGAGTGPGDTPELVLANPGDTRAIVDVTALTPSGLVSSSAGGNLVLAPHTLQPVQVTALAPGATVTAVHVQTQVGEVSAAVRDVRVSGTTPLGTDWVPVDEPTTDAFVPGLPASVAAIAPQRVLFVANPSDADTDVQVTLTTGNGTFVPTGLDRKTVPAESVVSIDLTAALGTAVGSARVRSLPGPDGRTLPVVAGALVTATSGLGNGIQEIAFTGAAQPITAPALVPSTPLPADTADSLLLSAPGQTPALISVTVFAPDGRALRTTGVPVDPGTSRSVDLASLGAVDGGSVVLTPLPTSSPFYATRLVEETGALGPLLSEYVVSGSPSSLTVPATAELPIGSQS